MASFPDLTLVRQSMGHPKRPLGWFKQPTIAFDPPPWMKGLTVKDDPLKGLFSEFSNLWKHGQIVWGRVLKANRLLFSKGDDDCPGEVLYSLTAPDAVAFARLKGLAGRLHTLGDLTEPPTELNERETAWWEDMNNDMVFHAGFKLPANWLADDHEFRVSSTLFHRAHLPDGFIRWRMMPVLVSPEMPFPALPVPLQYWPEELLKWLSENEEAAILPDNANAANDSRESRESAYIKILGPVSSVWHETEPRFPHIDVYRIDSREDRKFVTYITGGMSDEVQPGATEERQRRIELIAYAKSPSQPLAELLRVFGHYPFETGALLAGWDTVPLGHHAAQVLGTARLQNLLFIPATRPCDNGLAGLVSIGEEKVYPMMVIPLTDKEFEHYHADGAEAFLEQVRKSPIEMLFDPERPCIYQTDS